MAAKERTVPAGEFRSRCSALLEEVSATRISIVVTRRGKPVARVVPFEEQTSNSLLGSIVHEENIVSSLDERWEAAR